MPETRMLPKKTPRSTGIERTNVQTGRQQAVGTGASSHVSAAPGVGARVHEHVVNARNPAGMQKPPVQPPSKNGGVSVSRGRQDATVQLLDRRGNGGGFTKPTVTLMDATEAAKLARPGAHAGLQVQAGHRGAPQGFDARGAFSVDQLNLIGSLVGQYKEKVDAIGDEDTSKTCGDALERIAYLLKGGTFVTSATAGLAPAPSPIEGPGSPSEGTPDESSGEPDAQG